MISMIGASKIYSKNEHTVNLLISKNQSVKVKACKNFALKKDSCNSYQLVHEFIQSCDTEIFET